MKKIMMIQFAVVFTVLAVFLGTQGCDQEMPDTLASGQEEVSREASMEPNAEGKIVKTEAEWKALLSDKEYRVLREKGTELPYTGKYNTFFEDGVYKCGACGAELFASDSKFESHCGWPAFSAPTDANAVTESKDTSFGMTRTEIICSRCGSHLGHVFNDGPGPTGLRYCINSAALDFEKTDDETASK